MTWDGKARLAEAKAKSAAAKAALTEADLQELEQRRARARAAEAEREQAEAEKWKAEHVRLLFGKLQIVFSKHEVSVAPTLVRLTGNGARELLSAIIGERTNGIGNIVFTCMIEEVRFDHCRLTTFDERLGIAAFSYLTTA